MKKVIIYICLAVILIGISPLMVGFLGIGLISLFDCNFSMTVPSACIVWGADIGPTLMTMVMMHWVALVGVPLAALGLLVLVITLIISAIRRKS